MACWLVGHTDRFRAAVAQNAVTDLGVMWGLSDLPPIKEPIRELNRALTQLSMILELSGNPIAVLENVSESTDIAVMPGAVWELPERARAYLLDLLQGGGVKLHADYVDLIYRAMHDLGESPRTAFGDNRSGLSGVALNVGSGIETSLLELAELLLSVMGSGVGVEHGPPRRAAAIPRRLADVDRARRLLGFETTIGLEEGLRDLVTWWRLTKEPAVA